MSTELNPLAVEQPSRGFGELPCPRCGNEHGISINLNNFEHECSCHCHGCDETFSLTDLRSLFTAWERVLKWLATAPVVED